MMLNCLEHKFFKGFWSKGDSSHFENSPSCQISWICSDVFQINEKFIYNCLSRLLAEMAKVASSEARPRKCYINRLERFIQRHIRNRSTNGLAGNSLFSSEIILIANIKIEYQRWPEKPLILGRSGTQHVVMVTKPLSLYCGTHLVESQCKVSNISDTNWLRHLYHI